MLKRKLTSRAYDLLRMEMMSFSKEDTKLRCANTAWYNNGTQTIRIKSGEMIPVGFVVGRLKLPPRAGVIAITDGVNIKRISSSADIPDGWYKGFSEKTKQNMALVRKLPSSEGRKWVNDGMQNRYLKKGEPLPSGWVYGRLAVGNFNPAAMGASSRQLSP